jgi:dihydroxyacetone kinase-like protein
MKMDKALLKKVFSGIAELLAENKAYLNEIDSKFGDGDHGVTMDKIASLIKSELDAWTDAPISDFLSGLGDKTMCISGGSSSLLWGTFLGGLAGPVGDEEYLGMDMIGEMFSSALAELSGVTKAGAGDKTMMDAIIPAIEAIRRTPGDMPHVFAAAAAAARQGAKDTEKFVCGYGRAKNYGEKSVGTPDPGAISAGLFFEGFERAFL